MASPPAATEGQSMHCPGCRKLIPDARSYCAYCGRATHPTVKGRGWPFRAVALLALATLAMGWLLGGGPGGRPTPQVIEVIVTQDVAVTRLVEKVRQVTPTPGPATTKAAAAAATALPKVVRMTVLHQWWDSRYIEAIKAAFKDYEKSHPGVTIDVTNTDDMVNSLKVAIPAGQGPDIIAWSNDRIGSLALPGYIVPLDSYGIDQAFLTKTYEPAAAKGVVWQGKIWALPETQQGIALVYNKAILKDQYLPKDLADLLVKATQFQKDTGKVMVCNQGFGISDAYHVAPIYFGSGVPSYVDDTGKVYLNTPEGIKGAQWLADFAKVSLKENGYDVCATLMKEGKVGAWWTGPWAIAGIEEARIGYGILPMGKPFVGITTLMISSSAKARGTAEIALDISKYFTGADVQKRLSLVNNTIPAATGALKDPEVAKLAAIAGFGAALNVGVPLANTPYADAQWGPVGDASVAVWYFKQSPAEAMAAAQKAIEAKVKEMK